MAKVLKATKREDHKSSITRELRNQGQIPSVIYGKNKEAKSIAVNSLELVKLIRDEGRNAIISLDIDNDDSFNVMLHDYQSDVIKGEIIHADFYIVDLSEKMDADVTIRLEGEAAGAKEGGILQQPLFEVIVRAKPNNIPDEFVLDVSELNIGDLISVEDLPQSQTYEVLEEVDTTIATVLPPEEEELETTDEDENAEPELIGAEDEEE